MPQEDREEIISVCNEPRFRDQTPYEIVPQLLEEGRYLASESTFYRILREADQVHHRSQMRVGRRYGKPRERRATGSDQVYTWDITYMSRTIIGLFYYAYVVKDLYDRAIVGWAVYEEESQEHSKAMFDRILKGRKVKLKALHADNCHPMKGITLMALLQSLKV